MWKGFYENAAISPRFSQTPEKAADLAAKTVTAMPSMGLSPEAKAAWKQVASFRDVFAQFTKLKGAAYEVRVLYADEYVMVRPDGKETTKAVQRLGGSNHSALRQLVDELA